MHEGPGVRGERDSRRGALHDDLLYISDDLVIEIDEIILVGAGAELHRGAGMTVVLAGDDIRRQGAPLQCLAQFHEMLLKEFPDRTTVEFRIAEEPEKEFHRAVPRAAAEPVHGRIDTVNTQDDRLDCVGERELLVVVGVDPHLFPRPLDRVEILSHEDVELLAVERAETVHDEDDINRCRGEHLEGLIDFGVLDGGDGHEVAGGLIAFFVRALDHVHRFGDLVHITGHPDHVQDALILGKDVGLPVALAGIGHHREFQAGCLRVVVAGDAADILLRTAAEWTVLVLREKAPGVLVSDLHIIDARLNAGFVDRLDEIVVELMVVDETTVADGAVEHLQLRSVRHPGGFHAHAPFRLP